MPYLVKILVRYKSEVLNPEGRVIENAAKTLGYDVENLDKGKYFSYISKKKTKPETKKQALELSDKFLANPIIEKFDIISIKKTN